MSTFEVTINIGSPDRETFIQVEALVDTGSTFAWVPRSLLESLGHRPTGSARFETATGVVIERDVASVPIRINDEEVASRCVFGDEGSQPLLGAVALEEFLLAPDPVNKRLVKVTGLAMMAQRGKKYEEAVKEVDKEKAYLPQEAVETAKKAAYAKFDETLELHLRTGLDARHADQQLRGTVVLPHGLGRTVRVLVFAEGDGARLAQESGADYVGSDDLIARIEGGWLDFDVALAQRDLMTKVSRLGRVLGPRGLMPNPRTSTVLDPQDLPKAIQDARQGRVEFRVDRTSLVHVPVGKVSFEDEKLLDNIAAVIENIVRSRPSGAKGQYIRSATLTTTMGPGIKLDLAAALALRTS